MGDLQHLGLLAQTMDLSVDSDIWKATFFTLLWVICWLTPLGGLLYLAYFLISLPLRRQERARLFLDLIETALKQGRPIEDAIVSISESRDLSVGVRFHLVAAYLEKGLRLGQALEKVPRFLPPQISAMLQAGERIGAVGKVLPACRQLTNDALSRMRGAINYLITLVLVVTPVGMIVLSVLMTYIFPKLYEILDGMGVAPSPMTEILRRHQRLIPLLQLGFLLLFWTAALAYAGGPRIVSWLRAIRFGLLADRFIYWLPWRRKRMQRDFSAMLAILLDAQMPEAEAVTLAAGCTTNGIFKRRAEHTVIALTQGVKLTEAVQELDDAGEFRWRLTNATHAHGGFFRALAGWHEALDAKAFLQEQAAAQVATTALVIVNGTFVAAIMLTVFGVILSIVEGAGLW